MTIPVIRQILLTASCFLHILFAQDTDTTRVLFIGNSHTYFNSMPSMVMELATALDKKIIIDQHAPGGYSLSAHSHNNRTIEKIELGVWDYVVLQEHSLIPAIPYWRDTYMYPAIHRLDSMIVNNHGSTVLYMTWARKIAGEQCIYDTCSIEYEDFFHMQDSVSIAYTNAGKSIHSLLAPVGDAWAIFLSKYPELELWYTDDLHANVLGSYLTACVIFSTIFNEETVGLPSPKGIISDEALLCQLVTDSLLLHRDDNPQNPESYPLLHIYPNPFNSSTTIRFDLKTSGMTTLNVFSTRGGLIQHHEFGQLKTGMHEYVWKPVSAPSGIYLVEIISGDQSNFSKASFIK